LEGNWEGAEAFLLVAGNHFPVGCTKLHQLEPYAGFKAKNNGRPPPIWALVRGQLTLPGPAMKTTNDMPVVYPPSFDTLGVREF